MSTQCVFAVPPPSPLNSGPGGVLPGSLPGGGGSWILFHHADGCRAQLLGARVDARICPLTLPFCFPRGFRGLYIYIYLNVKCVSPLSVGLVCCPFYDAGHHTGFLVYGSYRGQLLVDSEPRGLCLTASLVYVPELVLFIFRCFVPLTPRSAPEDLPHLGVVKRSIFKDHFEPFYVDYFQ